MKRRRQHGGHGGYAGNLNGDTARGSKVAVQRSFSSDHVQGGYTDRSIHLNTAEVGVQVSELIADAMILFTDGDPTNDKDAIQKLATASKKCDELSHTHWLAADGNRAEAKKRARKMVEIGSNPAGK